MVKPEAIVVDTNVLLLLLVGSADVGYLNRHKRTARYDAQAYSIAHRFVSTFKSVLTTPHVLAETGNLLSGGLSGSAVLQVRQKFRAWCAKVDERHFPAHTLVQQEVGNWLGLTDSGIVRLARRKWAVLTDDLPLYVALQQRNLTVFNFTHIRLAVSKAT